MESILTMFRRRIEGREITSNLSRRTWVDWLLIAAATLILAVWGVIAHIPQKEIRNAWLVALTLGMLVVLLAAGLEPLRLK